MTQTAFALPRIIQGGMGIGVSNWSLARAVSRRGHLGVVSGTCMDSLMVRRLQDGDPGGHVRRAIAAFPFPEIGREVVEKYFLPEGRDEGRPYALLPMYRQTVSAMRDRITVLANFVEVYLAKEGHDGVVGVNLLTKIQMPNLASLYGAMMAGVDCVLMGAGIPKEIPGVLDAFAEGRPATMTLDVEGLDRGEKVEMTFDPSAVFPGASPVLHRPFFLPIISSDSLGRMLVKRANGRIDGFIVEGPTAGGHNAPPRGQTVYNERGEPIYGERDVTDLDVLAELGLPFWLAGGAGSPDGVRDALESGAHGVQIGTLFAYCDESGIDRDLKDRVLHKALGDELDVFTDDRASPTGFPFKVVQIDGTNASREAYEARTRVCDLGYLRAAYKRDDGRLGYRCASEPVDTYVKKGGTVENAAGRKCLCNALMADIGHPQVQKNGEVERAILTSGDDLVRISGFLDGRTTYSADDALSWLETGLPAHASDPAAAGEVAVVAGD